MAREFFKKFFVTQDILASIRERSKKRQLHPNRQGKKFQDLFDLLHREDLIWSAINELKSNKGADTPGIDLETLDGFSEFKVQQLAKEIKENTFKFSPVRRILIPKPGKKEKRPLGIPTFKDRVVQKMIHQILEAIYEPIFEIKQNDANYGFRNGRSPQQAIEFIKNKAKNTQWCIEGDIKGAYDSVSHPTLITLLKTQIDDKRFLQLIEQGLKSGTITKGHYEHSILGTPQGGIASPILFNIYMSELDDFIQNDIQEKINTWNRTENRVPAPRVAKYKSMVSANYRYKKKREAIEEKYKTSNKGFKDWETTDQEIMRKYTSGTQENRKAMLKTPTRNMKRALIRLVYIRYADDWVLLSNASKERIEDMKQMISNFLQNHLQLTLSPEKTKITDVKTQRVKFLGFSLSYYAQNIRKRKVTIRTNENRTANTTVKRTTGTTLVIGIDPDRLESRLTQKRFYQNRHNVVRGRRKPEWTTLTDYEIVQRYNYCIRGFINWYGITVRDYSHLSKYLYIFDYSCRHTLANKHKTTISKITNKYGTPITAKITTKEKSKVRKDHLNEIEKVAKLIDYKSGKDIIRKQLENKKETDRQTTDFLQVRVNWRTAYKLSKHCVICGSDKKVQMHHIKHIKKMGHTPKGFERVLINLNRKQITVCHACHVRIHRGKYDYMSLSDLYDPDLASY